MNENEKKITPDECIRKLNELALHVGKSRVSSQSGYLHHCYHPSNNEEHLTIPVYENFLLAYALLKSKTADNIGEAKTIISGLLSFQCVNGEFSKGNFPIYLHDFPNCKDRLLGIRLLPVIYWIYSQYSHILGENLNLQVKNSLLMLLNFCIKTSKEKRVPPSYQLTLEMAIQAINTTFDVQIEKINLISPHFSSDWLDARAQGKFLTALQLQYPSLVKSPWKSFWDYLEDTYHCTTAAYIGPSGQLFQEEEQPEVTIADFHLAAITGVLPSRLHHNSITMLQACLIQPYLDDFELINSNKISGSVDGAAWSYLKTDAYAMSVLECTLNRETSNWKGELPFRLVWGDLSHLSSLVAQGGNYQTLSTQIEEGGAILEYILGEEVDLEDRDQCREVILSFDRNESVKFNVNGFKATTFQLGDSVNVESKNIQMTVVFSIIEGSGDFFGHIMPGNRVSQLALKNSNRFNAYDWQLFLRTLRRSQKCKIGVAIKIKRT